ncbi:hypothetical protein ENH_00019230, partial [Eimeria necatrix]
MAKENEFSQEKAISIHESFAVTSKKPAAELISHRESAEAQDEGLAAQSPGSRTAYGLESWKSMSCTMQRHANVLKFLAAPQQHATAGVESHRVALQLLGAFADPKNYWEIANDALRENFKFTLQHSAAWPARGQFCAELP